MSFITLDGKITRMLPVETFPNFAKRIIWIEEQVASYANIWMLEVWNKDVAMMDNYKEGDIVTAYIDIKGRYFKNNDNREGVINTLKCWNIVKDGVSFKKLD
jgi:hypothetical protein